MPKRSDAKHKMIKTALHLFRERGYHGVGLSEILQESGAPKGSFYHHFPGGKQELALASVDAAGGFIIRVIDQAFENANSIEEGADAIIGLIAAMAENDNFSMGCPVTSFSVELTAADGEIRERVETVLDSWIARMVERAEPFCADEAELKHYASVFRAVLTTIEGGWIVSQVQRSPDAILLAKDVFRSMARQ